MSLKYYIQKAISLPPHRLLRGVLAIVKRKSFAVVVRGRDSVTTTYHKSVPGIRPLNLFLSRISSDTLKSQAATIKDVTDLFLQHKFDLLGSGWLSVNHGGDSPGLEGVKYYEEHSAETDRDGRWLSGRVNWSNLRRAKQVWKLVGEGYSAIDWHKDHKSGYRWSGRDWCKSVKYGDLPGVDIKMPWELARAQHLPLLAYAYILAADDVVGFYPADRYKLEFRNQVLDFISTNPPRFGVNWVCTMDVGIRLSNWLIAYDLFRSAGATFDEEFEDIFRCSVFEHSSHCAANLEYSEELTSNHYLADIVGLLFGAAYLPRAADTDAWLAFSVQELISEMRRQFHPDGTNFEASTCYHRLSTEMMLYAAGLILSLTDEKRQALDNYAENTSSLPRLKPRHSQEFQTGDPAILPDWFWRRLWLAGKFVSDITGPDGRVIQVGDNDSGRFLKLSPIYRSESQSDSVNSYLNLRSGGQLPKDPEACFVEDFLDHRYLVAAINSLFGAESLDWKDGQEYCEPIVIGGLKRSQDLSYAMSSAMKVHNGRSTDLATVTQTNDDITGTHYRDFGLYLFRSRYFQLSIHCGAIGQNGNGGHGHNDNLSIVLKARGEPIIVDPGTYLYTPAPELRNRFRSTLSHSTLSYHGFEQNSWLPGRLGLFWMKKEGEARVEDLGADRFVGSYRGKHYQHQRKIIAEADKILVEDVCDATGEKIVTWMLHPNVRCHIDSENNIVNLYSGKCQVRLESDEGTFNLEQGLYSSSYGKVQSTNVLRAIFSNNCLKWSMRIVNSEQSGRPA